MPFTADEILAITEPEDLFTAGQAQAKTRFHDLARVWHPDRVPGPLAAQVFAHISTLYERALTQDLWDDRRAKTLSYTDSSGMRYSFPYVRRRPFEMGTMYVTRSEIIYLIDEAMGDLAESSQRKTRNFKFRDEKVRVEVSRYLPNRPYEVSRTQDNRWIVTTPKPVDLISLRDVKEHCGGTLDIRHTMWILSSLYNLACYLSVVNQTAHCDISLDSYFICPEKHSGALLGGWFYRTHFGETLTQVPARTAAALPWSIKKDKKASAAVDLELIRLVGRELTPAAVSKEDEPAIAWFNALAGTDPIKEYEAWIALLNKRGRRFHKLDLTADQVYF